MAGAEKQLLEAISLIKNNIHDKHPYLALYHRQLGAVRVPLNRWEDAEQSFRDCIGILKNQVGLHHPLAVRAVENFSPVLVKRNKRNEADELFQELIRATEAKSGPRHPLVADCRVAYGQFLRDCSRPNDERLQLEEAMKIYRQTRHERRIRYLVGVRNLAQNLGASGQREDAEKMLRDVMPLVQARFGDSTAELAIFQSSLASAILNRGRADEEVEGCLSRLASP